MASVQLAAVLIVVGILLGMVNRYIPMAGSIKWSLNGVVIIVAVLWFLNVLGLFSSRSMVDVEYTANTESRWASKLAEV
jgi:uncharacterized transporter YbjL